MAGIFPHRQTGITFTPQNFLNVATEGLQNTVEGFNKITEPGDMEKFEAALAMVSSKHMTEAIASAFSKGKPISVSDMFELNSKTVRNFGNNRLGYFMEDITAGLPGNRSTQFADFNFGNVASQIRNNAKIDNLDRDKMNDSFMPMVKNFSFSEISKFLRKKGKGTHSGFESKAYGSTWYGVGVGQFTIDKAHTSEDVLERAIVKLFEKMNTLYLLSTFATGNDITDKTLILKAADLFHELMFDEIIKKLTMSMITVTTLKKRGESAADARQRRQTLETTGAYLGSASYEVTIDYSKLNSFIAEMANGVVNDLNATASGEYMTQMGIYKYHKNLYPGTGERNFFNDVLDYMYARTGIYTITK